MDALPQPRPGNDGGHGYDGGVRPLAILVIVGSLAVACDGEPPPVESPSATSSRSPTESPSPTASASPSPSASPQPTVIPPAWTTPIDRPIPGEQIPEGRLVPPGAEVTGTWFVPGTADIPDQVVATWGSGADPLRREQGLVVWERYPERPAWRPAYAFLDPPKSGVFGIRVLVGDLTGDGHEDLLAFEDRGGSGACGTWRVVAAVEFLPETIYEKDTCDADLTIHDGKLVIDEAVFKPGDAHCCPSAYRAITLQYDGGRWKVVRREVTPTG